MKVIKLNAAPLVSDRPKCPQCSARLRPYWKLVADNHKGDVSQWTRAERWDGTYHGYGAFCTLRCAARYANEVYQQLKAKRRRI